MSSWADDSDRDPEWELDSPANVLADKERSFALWQLCHASDWKVLPKAGGWEDQSDVFLRDALIITRRLGQLKTIKRRDKESQKKAERKLLGRGLFRK